MEKPELSYSTPVKFELGTLKKLRESALANQRSLSGEVRFRILQTLELKDSDRNQAERTIVISKKQTAGGYDER